MTRQRKWQKSHPGIARAHRIVRQALQSGKLLRPARCANCGVACYPEAHHPDYRRPLEVNWLCGDCHTAAHQQKRKPQNRVRVPGRCANCGKRWKRGQPTKQYCSAYCRQAAWWERHFYRKLKEAASR